LTTSEAKMSFSAAALLSRMISTALPRTTIVTADRSLHRNRDAFKLS
jgi:hypothetical protein